MKSLLELKIPTQSTFPFVKKEIAEKVAHGLADKFKFVLVEPEGDKWIVRYAVKLTSEMRKEIKAAETSTNGNARLKRRQA